MDQHSRSEWNSVRDGLIQGHPSAATRLYELARPLPVWLDVSIASSDAIQEVILSVLERVAKRGDGDSFASIQDLRTYVVAVARNQERNRRARRLRQELVIQRLIAKARLAPPRSAIADRDTPAARIARALSRLRPQDRLLIELFHLQDRPANEVARLLGLISIRASSASVQSALRRARSRLHGFLEAEGD